jgi:small conductance mechanosensitive channel
MDASALFDRDTLSQTAQAVIDILTSYGLSVIGAAFILILGWTAAGWISHAVARSLSRIGRIDDMLRGFLASLVRYFVLALTVIAVLGQFGVQTTSLVAVLGAAGLAIGLALQGTLSSLAGGAMLLLFRPFKVGDSIEASGHSGTVKALTLFTTELATADNVRVIVPNSDLWGKAIRNHSANPTRRAEIVFPVPLGKDIDRALAVAREVLAAEPRILADPAPAVAINEMSDKAMLLAARFWCKTADLGAARSDTIKALRQALERAELV